MAVTALTLALIAVLVAFFAEQIIIREYFKPPKHHCAAIVIPTGKSEELESVLMHTYAKLRCGFNSGGALYFIKNDADCEELMIAEAFCRDHYGAIVTDKENLHDILGDSVYKTVLFVLY